MVQISTFDDNSAWLIIGNILCWQKV